MIGKGDRSMNLGFKGNHGARVDCFKNGDPLNLIVK
jgi:hypothetical protein